MEKIRVQKLLSDAGITSRRGAERDIAEGLVTVNGRVCELGTKVDPMHDVVVYKGKRVSNIPEKKLYVMLNKPRGYVTSLHDEYDRKCIAELLTDLPCRVYPIGRLDKDSEGLLLLTNDGDFANKMMHPSGNISKVYHARVRPALTDSAYKILTSPMEIDGYKIKPVKVSLLESTEVSSLLRFELKEGRNRQIRKMCEQASLNVVRLQRVAEGDISMDKLPVGKWKYLTKAQIEYLKNKLDKNVKP